MALPADYISGTITLTNGSPNFTGTGTGWQAADFREGDILLGVEDHAGQVYVIATITSQTSGTLTQEWAGTSGTYTYRMRYEWDSSRVSAQSRAMVELLGNGNLESIAGLTGPGVVVLEGPHSAGIRPFTDFINGVAYDVQVDTLSDRAAYDGQAVGFAVLVSDTGDGRSALFSKASNTSGDWTDAAYITGPVGPLPEVEATVDMLPPGSTATVTPTPITGGVRLDFELPEASGFYNAGVYDIAEAYSQDDVVRHNGSSFIALQAVPAGTSPSNAFPPTDTAYWQVLAAKGADGTGTGDFVGPNGSVAGRLVSFADASGKLGADSGFSIQTSQTDTGADKVLRVGAYGLGGEALPVSDWNSVDINGALYHGFSAANAPISGDLLGSYSRLSPLYGVLVVRATTGSQPREFMRIKNNGSWQAWSEIYHSRNVLGVVSQSGGVPTGSLFERGSNANGSYLRLPDGTQFCWAKSSVLTTADTAEGPFFRNLTATTMTLPATFAAAPSLNPFVDRSTSPSGGLCLAAAAGSTPSTTEISLYILGTFNGANGYLGYIATGRWF